MRARPVAPALVLLVVAGCYDVDAFGRCFGSDASDCVRSSGADGGDGAADHDAGDDAAPPTSCVGNLLTDGDFESGTGAWIPENGPSLRVVEADAGSPHALLVCNDDVAATDHFGAARTLPFAVATGDHLQVRGAVRAQGSGEQQVEWAFFDPSFTTGRGQIVTASWTIVEEDFYVKHDGDAGGLGVQLRSEGNPPSTACFQLDAVCVVRVP